MAFQTVGYSRQQQLTGTARLSPLHIYKVFENIPEAYNTAILVVVHHKYVTYYNVLESSMVCKLA